ncbi:Uncharacterised protein [Mycobacterium tuberculosis]|uniref:Uncharacterized protein n=1 Tax=Mycobacterium tuberculosis TaxID=1773 RepID=A0A655ALF0_MYCTX|nr:Uncharacterised protein [Mycobacterium tuberculosis]
MRNAVPQLVPLRRYLGALDRDHRIIGQHWTTSVGWLQLNVPRRHQGGVEDHRGGIGRHLVLVLVVESHLHFVAGWFDLVDRTDREAHNLDLVSDIQRIGLGEVGDHRVVRQFLIEPHTNNSGGQRQHHHQRSDDNRGPRQLRQPQVADIKDGAQFSLPPVTPLPPVPPGLMNGAGNCGPGPGGAGGPGAAGGGAGPGAGPRGSVRAPGGASCGIGTGVPGTFGGTSPGRPAIGRPGAGGGPSGFGGDVATSSGAGKSGPPNGP